MSDEFTGICLRKRPYASWDEAEENALRLMDEGDRKHIEAYRCEFCVLWHIGHPPGVSRAPANSPTRGIYIRTRIRP